MFKQLFVIIGREVYIFKYKWAGSCKERLGDINGISKNGGLSFPRKWEGMEVESGAGGGGGGLAL